MILKIISEGGVNNSPWLPCDKQWKGEFLQERLRIRLSRFGKRVDILPVVEFNWEEGIFTFQFGWLFAIISFDWMFDADWGESKEADVARQDERNEGLKI
jgi:hypothetical protein